MPVLALASPKDVCFRGSGHLVRRREVIPICEYAIQIVPLQ